MHVCKIWDVDNEAEVWIFLQESLEYTRGKALIRSKPAIVQVADEPKSSKMADKNRYRALNYG